MLQMHSTVALFCFVLFWTTTQSTKISRETEAQLAAKGSINVMISFDEGIAPAIEKLAKESFVSFTREEKIKLLVQSLEQQTFKAQQPIEKLLLQESSKAVTEMVSFWVANTVYLKHASRPLLEKISQFPHVKSIEVEHIVPLIQPIDTPVETLSVVGVDTPQWGVQKVGAPELWGQNITGEGVIVGGIDTGVLGTHETLVHNFRGNFGWYDPGRKTDVPNDQNGHGTHTIATIAGGLGVGVAPKASWMACKGCANSGCSESDLLACLQFMVCPHDTNGNNKDCSKAPHLVNNSWGTRGGVSSFVDAVKALHEAGIIPIFSNGNSGPHCLTTGSPGDYANVISVGATNVKDELWEASSKGPSNIGGLFKPDISAPGEKILSASPKNETAYYVTSGTSMAAPHVAGVVALILQKHPEYSYKKIYESLIQNTYQSVLTPTGYKCGGIDEKVFPNHSFGYGLINAVEAIK